MDADDRANLEHEFPDEGVVCLFVYSADVDCCILIAFIVREPGCHPSRTRESELAKIWDRPQVSVRA
jgi:hypothetical protein